MSENIRKIETDTSVYKGEIIDTLQKLTEKMPNYPEVDFFTDIVKKHYLDALKRDSPKVIVIGSGIPEELFLAAGIVPYWILGGSRAASIWADDMVPRDTDPVSRSVLGQILQIYPGKKTLILIPLVSDSMRKLAYILRKMGLNVHTFHFPPLKEKASLEEWNRQYEDCMAALARHQKKWLTERDLKKCREELWQAQRQIGEFFEASKGVLNGSVRMFVLNSYYCADQRMEWYDRLRTLTARLQRGKYSRSSGKSKVMLFGSPIYFPNYKVPFLIEEAGMELCAQADCTTLPIQAGSWQLLDREQEGISADTFYEGDVSSAYVKNDSLYEAAIRMASEQKVDGIVYHVLKGQIEYDFELGRLEEAFERMDIPVFRLETDYNYQDVEQLRIRLEAFSEVLQQRKYKEEAMAI